MEDENVEFHPLARNANEERKEELSVIEKACAWVSDKMGSPSVLFGVIVVQGIWIVVGQITKLDAYPFAFLLTFSNILQLILMFVLALGQRQTSKLAQIRADIDHESISHILIHQDLQEEALILILKSLKIDSSEVDPLIKKLEDLKG